eukprot:gene5134-5374_t
MERLGAETVRQLQAAGAPDDHVGLLSELRSISFLAAAFARLGLVHEELFTELAVRGAKLLRMRDMRLTQRSHGTHIALLAAAYSSLKLYPPQLFRSITELLKQQRSVLKLLGPEEAMLLCWSLAWVQHHDLPAQLLLTQRATTQAGSAGLTAPPLLAALRKAVRQRLPNMHPHQLTAVLVSLSALGQQDQLLLDEVAKAIHGKLANFTAAQIVTVFSSCSLLQYCNPWLLEHASKMLVSRRMQKAAQVTGQQLSDLLVACRQLQYFNPLLLAYLGTTAAAGLVDTLMVPELTGVVQGYQLAGYQHTQLLQAAAARLRRLAEGEQEMQHEQLACLIAAAHALASMPGVGVGPPQPGDRTAAAVLAVAAAAVQLDPVLNFTEGIMLVSALVICDLLPAECAEVPAEASGAGAAQQMQQQQGLDMQRAAAGLGQRVLGNVRERSEAFLGSLNERDHQQRAMASLLHLMQLLWLKQHSSGRRRSRQHWNGQQSAVLPSQASPLQQAPGQQRAVGDSCSSHSQHMQHLEDGEQPPMWWLGLPERAVHHILKLQTELWQLQQQQQGPLLQSVLTGVRQASLQIAAEIGQIDTSIVSPYQIPDSPMLLAAAIFPAAASTTRAAAAAAARARRADTVLPDSGRFLLVGLLQRKGLKPHLPQHVVAFLQECTISRTPVAVFIAGNAAGGMDDWHSSSVPRVLLPEADLYRRGLQAVGWKRVLSGVQPTGQLHLGNYMGAIKNWVKLQDQYDTFYCVVDLHAITAPHDPVELRAATRSVAATYMAAGIDPDKASIFVQSHVTAHAELNWLLECVTPIGWLNRMIQFKEKARKQGEDVRAGLMTYPVLMAADILLYQLTRDIADRVNSVYGGKKWKKRGGRGGNIFKVPEPLIPPAGARIMSLQDGTSKMSKSAENDASRINLTDSPDAIRNKIKRCKTDSAPVLEWDNPERPEATNLLTLYQLSTAKTKDEVLSDIEGMNWGAFKPLLADALIAHLEPIQTKYQDIMKGMILKGKQAVMLSKNDFGEMHNDDVQGKDAMGFVVPARVY